MGDGRWEVGDGVTPPTPPYKGGALLPPLSCLASMRRKPPQSEPLYKGRVRVGYRDYASSLIDLCIRSNSNTMAV